MFEIIVISLCVVVFMLLVSLHHQYGQMDDEKVLSYTSIKAVFKKLSVDPHKAKESAKKRSMFFRVTSIIYFLIAAVFTGAVINSVIAKHPPGSLYIEVTSGLILVDTELFLGVLMIFAVWAVFIAMFYTGRKVIRRENEVLDGFIAPQKQAEASREKPARGEEEQEPSG